MDQFPLGYVGNISLYYTTGRAAHLTLKIVALGATEPTVYGPSGTGIEETETGVYDIEQFTYPATAGRYRVYWYDDSVFIPGAFDEFEVSGSAAVFTAVGGSNVVNTLIDRVRRSIRDYPAKDALFSPMDTPDTVVTVTNPTAGYAPGKVIVIDQEAMFVTSVATGNGPGATFTVNRGWLGTAPATHTAGAPVLIDVRYSPQDVLDALNEGVRQLWPYFFQWVEDETTVSTSDLRGDYPIPPAFGASGIITSMEFLFPGLANDAWRRFRWFRHLEGSISGRLFTLIRIPPVGTKIRCIGIAPYVDDLAFGGTTDPSMLDSAITAIVMYARFQLKMTDEAGRENTATAKNIGPAAVQGGANLALAQVYQKQWQDYCVQHAQRWPAMQTRRRI